MGEFIKWLAHLVNETHDLFLVFNRFFGLHLSDKDLHFWIFGLVGFIIFILVDLLFKWIARWNLSIISFIYTFTVMAVIALALEVMQKVTGRGNMEFLDFAYGVWGFLVLAGLSLMVKLIIAYWKRRRRS